MGFVGSLSHGKPRLILKKGKNMRSFEEEVRAIKQMKPEAFLTYINERRSDIHSFPGLIPPNGAKFLGLLNREDDIYAYYMDEEGEMYYENDKGHAFKKKIAKIQLQMELDKRAKEKGLVGGRDLKLTE